MLNELLNAMMMAELLFEKVKPRSFKRPQVSQKAGIRILHVDDEPEVRELVELSLGLEPDLETWSCASGTEALAVAADWKPDLILLDLIMPQMGGVATLARLRVDAELRVPVVLMTGFRGASEPDYFRSLGAAGVISKPFEPASLAASVRDFLP